MATSCWGDVCILGPWAEYEATGDLGVLARHYPTMKQFLHAAQWWSHLFSIRKDRRMIWKYPFHFGDWTAPDTTTRGWLNRGPWIATAYFSRSCDVVAQIADLLGYLPEGAHYRALRDRARSAYRNVFTDGSGTLAKPFQSAYVLPLAFHMTEGEETAAMARNLVSLIDEADGHLATGFPATPYILLSLSDNGHLEDAYRLLLQQSAPSWLYMTENGGTTTWERWDALRPDGTVNTVDLATGKDNGKGGMVSFNHYAAGAVGMWLYRRMVGIEPVEGGYKRFRVAPMPGGGVTEARAATRTPYGRVSAAWRITADNTFHLDIEVPVSTQADVVLPDGTAYQAASGTHTYACALPKGGEQR